MPSPGAHQLFVHAHATIAVATAIQSTTRQLQTNTCLCRDGDGLPKAKPGCIAQHLLHTGAPIDTAALALVRCEHEACCGDLSKPLCKLCIGWQHARPVGRAGGC